MIYTVTLNPSLDYIIKTDRIEFGAVNRISNETILPGGKGINVSMVLNNMGIDNKALGFCAGSTGKMLKDLLDEQNVAYDFLDINQGMTRINVKILTNQETNVNGNGPFISENDMQRLYDKLDTISKGDILILAGSIPACLKDTIYLDIVKRICEKNIEFVIDATGKLLTNVLPYKPFLIKPNDVELGEIFGVTIDSFESASIYGKKLVEMGAKNVLVSMGPKGGLLVTSDGSIYKCEAPDGKVVNTVGAGDSMLAGFLTGYLLHNDYEYALRMGVCTGSASAFSDNLATKEEVMKLMN